MYVQTCPCPCPGPTQQVRHVLVTKSRYYDSDRTQQSYTKHLSMCMPDQNMLPAAMRSTYACTLLRQTFSPQLIYQVTNPRPSRRLPDLVILLIVTISSIVQARPFRLGTYRVEPSKRRVFTWPRVVICNSIARSQ